MKLRVFLYRLFFGNGQAYYSPYHWAVADWLACKPNGIPSKRFAEFVALLERMTK